MYIKIFLVVIIAVGALKASDFANSKVQLSEDGELNPQPLPPIAEEEVTLSA